MVRPLALFMLLALAMQARAEIGIDAHLSSVHPWLRQEVLLSVEVLDDRSLIEQHIPDWTPPGVSVRRLGSRQERVQTAAGVRIRHRHLWAIMPLYPGPLTLQPPTIEARSSGGRRLELTPPALHMEVRPLDALLPVDLPVGRLRIESDPLPAALPRGRPVRVQLAIFGQGLSARGIERWLAESLRDTGSLRTYPPEVRVVGMIDPASPLLQRAEVHLSFEPLTLGRVRLPELSLPYVDPADGKPKLARIALGEFTVQHPLWLALRPWLPWAGGAALVLAIAALAAPRLRRLRARRAWRHAIEAAANPHALRRAWHAGASAQESEAARDELALLDAACYGRKPLPAAAFQALKARLLQRIT